MRERTGLIAHHVLFGKLRGARNLYYLGKEHATLLRSMGFRSFIFYKGYAQLWGSFQADGLREKLAMVDFHHQVCHHTKKRQRLNLCLFFMINT
jgi:hypothetical protein